MKPKQQFDPNVAGEVAQRLLAEDSTANATLKDMRTAKVARKESLKVALTVVWQAFESGATVNGYSSRNEWCKEYARCTPRHAQHIIYGRKERKANHGSLTLKPGIFIKVGKREFVLTEEIIAAIIAAAPAPITHVKFSPRKAWCQTRFVNRKIKNIVFAKNAEVTCSDCRAMLSKKVMHPSAQTLENVLSGCPSEEVL